MRRTVALILIATLLSGCANQGLRVLRSNSSGPDEFLVEPKAALETPDDLTALPVPTPGQGNRTDIDPLSDAVVALGGRPSDPAAGIPGSDGALVTAASRFGVTPSIRSQLAAEDEDFRRRQSRFTQIRLFPEDRYNTAYKSQALDAEETAESWRRAGAKTPSYPPQN
ncbi:DUF3035 domain-containing protein [uncultured Roseobacter sp.]|uniref:DUF3035 domain-containing protein n=1 Tax=uncultured Roseobacter sp. TaxID=114847 RepID=UPI00262A050D|nr:DUF3035 domain-containing protein [uncultured Roseobacter sp.]